METGRITSATVALGLVALAVTITVPEFARPCALPAPGVGGAVAPRAAMGAAQGSEQPQRTSLRRGDRSLYTIELQSTLELGEQRVTTQIHGRLTVVPILERGGEVLAEVSFPGSRVSLDGPSGPEVAAYCAALEAALARPTLVRQDEAGRTLGYRFDPRAVADHRNWVRALVSAFRFAVLRRDAAPAGPGGIRGTGWETVEADDTGNARRRYRVARAGADGFELVRTRLGYEEFPEAATAGCATAEFRGDRPVAMHVDETLVVPLAEVATAVRHALRGSATLVSVDQVDRPPGVEWDGRWAPASGRGEKSEVARVAEERAWQRRLDEVGLADLLARITRSGAVDAAADDVVEAVALLAKAVELRAGAAAAVAALVRDPSADGAVAALLLGALARAGTAEAQELLADCAEDTTLVPARRIAALEAMFALASPSGPLADRISRMFSRSAPLGDVERSAMLVLGALAGRDGSRFGDLIGLESRARAENAVPLWLEAIGNAGTGRALDVARRFAGDPDDSIRAAAMSALRKIETPEAAALLTEAATRDPAATVRRTAVTVLAACGAAVEFATFAAIARADGDASVRRAAVLALVARDAVDARLRDVLARMAAEDPSVDLRRLARRLLEA